MAECEDSNNEIEVNRLKFQNGRAKTLAEIAREASFNSNFNATPDCVDELDLLQIENRKYKQSPKQTTYNGFYTINAVNDMASQFETQMVFAAGGGTLIDRYSSTYGQGFYDSLRDLNDFLENQDPLDYEFLKERLDNDQPISEIEFAEFLNEFMFTPITLQNAILTFPDRLLFQLDDFYNKNFTQSAIGAFCSLMPQVFQAIEFFFDALDLIRGGIAGIVNRLGQAALRELIEKIVSQVKAVIERKIKSELEKILNFRIEDFFENVETFINENIIARIHQIKEDILNFFNPENVQKIVDRVEGLVSYAVSVFTNPSLEAIQFLVYRFCSFAAQVEKIIDMIKNPLVAFSGGFNGIVQRLRVVSNLNTSTALAAGAWRYSPDQRQILINTSEEQFRARGNPPPLTPADSTNIPTWEDLRNGVDSRFSVRIGNQSFASNPPGQRQEEGWTGLNPVLQARLVRVQERFGRRIEIISGYRNELLNDAVDGKPGSQHLDGNAVDLSWSGFNSSSREEFIRIAREEGFLGFGRYPTQGFVHIDLGPARQWTG